jgi:MFS family permease
MIRPHGCAGKAPGSNHAGETMAQISLQAAGKAREVTDELTSLYRKLDLRILPFLLLCYTLAYLDRINLGFAKLQMQKDIGIDDGAYGLAAGIFFLGYVMFEIPSNLLLAKIGARKTISRIMILWGVTSAATMFVTNPAGFYVLRFLLGVFEAGFAPGMVFYLTYWYSGARMARVLAIVMLAAPIGGIIGGPLSTFVMTALGGAYGLHGWQWMFLVEGLPCISIGIIAFWYLADRPSDAQCLSEREVALIDRDVGERQQGAHESFGDALRDPRIYVLAFGYLCLISGIYTVSFWLPTILTGMGVTDVLEVGLYSMIPYTVAAASMLLFARLSDRKQERRWHSALLAFASAAALVIATVPTHNFIVSLTGITLATAFVFSSYTVFWAIPSQYLKGTAAAGGIALINSIGLLGGFFSPTLIGTVKTLTHSLEGGLYAMAGLLLAGGVAILCTPAPRKSGL